MAHTCNKCGATESLTIPYIVHEDDMARSERYNKRLWIAILILIVALVCSNVAWIVYESRFETIDVEQDVEQNARNGDNNNFVGGDYHGISEDTHKN